MSRHCGKQSDGVVAAMRDGGRYVWRLMTAFIYIGFLVLSRMERSTVFYNSSVIQLLGLRFKLDCFLTSQF